MCAVHLQVRTLQPQGVQSWWQPGHPGWAIYPVDSDHFLSTGVLDSVSVNTESISAPPPSGSPGTVFGGCMRPTANQMSRTATKTPEGVHQAS